MTTDGSRANWTAAVGGTGVRALAQDQLLLEEQRASVASGFYAFGVATLLVIIGTGTMLAIKGRSWRHGSDLGHFVNNTHLRSVELCY